MSLEEQVAEAIVIAFDKLGGNPKDAVRQAMKHDNVEDWIRQEIAIIGLIGGAEMAIPGIHALTITTGIAYMIHKMAYISWGIGALKRAYIVETPYYSDMRNILTLWANNSDYDPHILDHMAIGLDAFEYAITDDGYARVQILKDKEEADDVVISSMSVLENLVYRFADDKGAQELVHLLKSRDEIYDLVVTAKDKASTNESVLDRKLERSISQKLALRLSARISARVPARFVMGWLPIAGPLVNAVFNAQSLHGFAQVALSYYDNQITHSTLEE